MASPSVLVVEDGTGKATANSYSSVEDADAYFNSIGNTEWGVAPSSLKEDALIRATRALDALYGGRWKGEQSYYGTQALNWPRAYVTHESYAFPSTALPACLKKALYEAALRELQSAGILTPDLDRGGQIQSVQAGPVAVTYFAGAPAKTVITILDGMLAPIIRGASVEVVLG